MRLEMKRERELAKRKGNTWRTVLGAIWLAFCFGVAYLVTQWLISSETLTLQRMRTYLFVPPTVDDIWIRLGEMLVVVVVMQLLVLIVYAFTSRSGRRRPGDASMYSRNPDPNADKYDYR